MATPHLAKTDLYYKTGHLPYYAEHMYPFMELREKRETEGGTVEELKETYALRPMNCPHHHRILRRVLARIAICRCASPSTAKFIGSKTRGLFRAYFACAACA